MKFRSSTVLPFYRLPPNIRLPQGQPSSLGFHFHEICFILIDEAEMVWGGGRVALLPSPPRMRAPPLPLYKIAGGRGGTRAAPSLSSLAYASPTHANETRSIYLPVGFR